jgi:hypothetical protein
VRQEEQRGEPRGEPGPARGEPPAVRREQQAEERPADEPQHTRLVEQAEAQHEPERQPGARAAAVERAQEQQRAQRPEERVEDVHAEEVVHRQPHGRQHRAQAGQRLREAAPAELAREQARDEHGARSGQGRQPAQREERVAEERAVQRQQHDRERRLIHVAPGEVVAAGDVVQLVAEVAEAHHGQRVQHELERGEDERHGERVARTQAVGHGGLRGGSDAWSLWPRATALNSGGGGMPRRCLLAGAVTHVASLIRSQCARGGPRNCHPSPQSDL